MSRWTAPTPPRYWRDGNLLVISDLQPPRRPPIVEVRRVRHRDGDLLVIERCPYCKRLHQHGAAGKSTCGDHGHRLAHCRHIAWDNIGYLLWEPCDEPATVQAG